MYIGIDFGTSNTAFAFLQDGMPVMIPLEEHADSIPTAVFYGTTGEQYSIGSRAVRMYEAGEDGRLMRSIKSVLGSALIDETTQLGDRRLPFRTVIADFLRHTINTAQQQLGRPIEGVVQGRPVSFNDTDPEKDKRAQDILCQCLRDAGVANVVFLEEPVAAARSVTFAQGREKMVFVIDIGGGTSDFSVIRISDDNSDFDVLASAGVYVGGNDFDRLLSLHELATLFGKDEVLEINGLPAPISIYSKLSEWKSLNQLYARDAQKTLTWMRMNSPNSQAIKALDYLISHHQGHAYAAETEAIKIGLSTADTQIFSFQGAEARLEKPVQRARFESLIEDTVGKMDVTADECLAGAGIANDQITDVVMVGGSTHIPLVAKRLASKFQHANVSNNDRFSAVAKGLAAHGAALN